MLNLYVVSRAGSFLRHAVHMLSLCDYYDLCGCNSTWFQITPWNKVVGKNLSSTMCCTIGLPAELRLLFGKSGEKKIIGTIFYSRW